MIKLKIFNDKNLINEVQANNYKDIIYDNDVNTEILFNSGFIHSSYTTVNTDFYFEVPIKIKELSFRETSEKSNTVYGSGETSVYYLYEDGTSTLSTTLLDKNVIGFRQKAQTHSNSGAANTFTYKLYIKEISFDVVFAKPTENKNGLQLLSQTYDIDNVLRKDYIGNLEDCNIATYKILENINKVSNNEIKQTSIKTISEDKFILE